MKYTFLWLGAFQVEKLPFSFPKSSKSQLPWKLVLSHEAWALQGKQALSGALFTVLQERSFQLKRVVWFLMELLKMSRVLM